MKGIGRVLFWIFIGVIMPGNLRAQCQDQVCSFESNCYRCFGFAGFACGPGHGRCPQTCTETHCAASPASGQSVSNQPAASVLSAQPYPQPLAKHSVEPMTDACVEQMNKGEQPIAARPGAVSTLAEWQKNSPVNIREWTVAHNQDDNFVVKRIVVENLGSAPVFRLQMGWMLIFDDREPEIHVLEPMSVAKLESKGVLEIGEPLPDYSVTDESVARSQEAAFVSSATDAIPAITRAPGLRAINLFVAAVNRGGLPEFREDAAKLSTQLKAKVLQPKKSQ